MLNFKTKCKTGYIFTSLATWGSSLVSKEAKFNKEFDFLNFSGCFSARIEQSSKTSKMQPNCVIFGWFFEVCSILTEKQRLKARKSKSLMNFASCLTQLARLVEWNESGVKKPSVNCIPKMSILKGFFDKMVWVRAGKNWAHFW